MRRTLYISKLLHTGCSAKERITASFTEHLKFLQMHFGLIVANQNKKKTKMKTLCIFKMLYAGYSMNEVIFLLYSQSTQYLKKEWLLLMQFGLIVANQNKKETRAKR